MSVTCQKLSSCLDLLNLVDVSSGQTHRVPYCSESVTGSSPTPRYSCILQKTVKQEPKVQSLERKTLVCWLAKVTHKHTRAHAHTHARAHTHWAHPQILRVFFLSSFPPFPKNEGEESEETETEEEEGLLLRRLLPHHFRGLRHDESTQDTEEELRSLNQSASGGEMFFFFTLHVAMIT